jgi:uncharacterized protein (DUF39 family)
MGNKKQQQRVQQSMGNMVSKAALTQLGPEIAQMINNGLQQVANQLAQEQLSTLATMFVRIRVLEEIVVEKLGYTQDQLAQKVSDIEDKSENLQTADVAQVDDVVRVEVKTKTKDQTEFQGSTRLKITELGSGASIGKELEAKLIGMKVGEVKETEFGQGMVAELTIDRISRKVATTGAADATANPA